MKLTNLMRISEMKLPARASLFYLLSGFLGKSLGFVSTLFFTRLLTPSDYGEYAVYMSWLGIGETCISAFISGSVIYKGFTDFKEKTEAFLSTLIATFLLFTTAFCLLLFAFYAFFGYTVLLFPCLFLQILFDGILSVRLYEKKHLYKYRTVVITGISEAVISIAVSLLLIRYAGLGFVGRIIGYLIPTAILGFIYIFRGHFPKFDGEIFRYLIKRTLPLLPSTVALALTMQADKLIINSLLGSVATARYSVVHSVGVSGIFLVTAIGSALYPWINRKLSSKSYENIIEVTEPMLSFFTSFSVFLVAIAPLAIRILAPDEYTAALPAFAPLAISIIPYFSANLNTVYLIHLGLEKDVSKITVTSGILGVFGSIILIRYLGYLGAGLSGLLSSASTYIGGLACLSRKGKAQIIHPKSVLSSFAVAMLITVLISLSESAPYFIPLLLIPSAVSLINSALKTKKLIFE